MRTITIQFTNGDKVSLEFPDQHVDTNRWAQFTERLFSQQYLMFELSGAMLMYPVQNIRSIQLYPAPDLMPDYCIRGAQLAP
jgi:hypothetical protein